MLLIKTRIAPSDINGIGLFADEDIHQGTITWKFTPGFDLYFSKEEMNKLPLKLKDFIQTYAALSMVTGKYVLGSDDVRFTNHSSTPNLESVKINSETEKVARALRDIKKGEELTIDYRQFDEADANSTREYLNV
jgi:SET domain-containing protein